MSDLAGFLLARIAEDEATAKRSCSTLLIANLDRCAIPSSDEQATFRHHERWEPPRVLAECESKRRIVDAYLRFRSLGRGDPMLTVTQETLRNVLGKMTLPYADHPDYDPEWRP